jgi:hypothetical protein
MIENWLVRANDEFPSCLYSCPYRDFCDGEGCQFLDDEEDLRLVLAERKYDEEALND